MPDPNIVIAGYAETAIEFKSGRSAYDFGGEAFAALLAATGVPKDRVDGLSVTAPLSECANPFFAVYVVEALGLSPTWLNYGGLRGAVDGRAVPAS